MSEKVRAEKSLKEKGLIQMCIVAIVSGLCLVSYVIGYKIGYSDCFKYLKQKLEEYKHAKEM